MKASQNTAHTRRVRPTDATGLFWAFILLVLAWLFSLTPKSNDWRPLLLLGVPFALAYQIWVWRRDATILREAEAFRRLHFPHAEPWLTLRFLVALSHECERTAAEFHPNMSLDALNEAVSDPEIVPPLTASDKARWHQHWLGWVFIAADLKNVNVEQLPTDTLGNVVNALFGQMSQPGGNIYRALRS